jgi:hypothetical protein
MLDRLPLEIFALVLDHLDDDETLTNFSLVCKALCVMSQKRLWGQMTVRDGDDLCSLLDMLKASPHLGTYIRKLRVSSSCSWISRRKDSAKFVEEGCRQAASVPALDALFPWLDDIEHFNLVAYTHCVFSMPQSISPPCFRHTRSLVVGGIFDTFDDFLAVVTSFPGVVELTMSHVRLNHEPTERSHRPALAQSIPHLQQLEIWRSSISPYWLPFYYRWLAGQSNSRLKRLVLHSTSEHDWEALGALIDNLPELQYLSLATPLSRSPSQ